MPVTALASRPARGPGRDRTGADVGTAELLNDLAARLGYRIQRGKNRPQLVQRDGRVAEAWRQDFPYGELLRPKRYDKAKRALQIELLKLQHHVKASGGRLVIVFEGRDAAGKGEIGRAHV